MRFPTDPLSTTPIYFSEGIAILCSSQVAKIYVRTTRSPSLCTILSSRHSDWDFNWLAFPKQLRPCISNVGGWRRQPFLLELVTLTHSLELWNSGFV
ncbi:hypothetical protein JTE90_024091 [Oedothorax gibbosus]|uniref:Uncharacterized protein n=1 Tax=Oedothorax gibbosus TaxID=931172 RepID=A0AAV6UTD0_9ARAC|nr:hypothetical protein JTE90_024091 [Oedothorax gibbosus]